MNASLPSQRITTIKRRNYDKNRFTNMQDYAHKINPGYEANFPGVDGWQKRINGRRVGGVRIGSGVISEFLRKGRDMEFYPHIPGSYRQWSLARYHLAAVWDKFCANFVAIASAVIPDWDPVKEAFLIPVAQTAQQSSGANDDDPTEFVAESNAHGWDSEMTDQNEQFGQDAGQEGDSILNDEFGFSNGFDGFSDGSGGFSDGFGGFGDLPDQE